MANPFVAAGGNLDGDAAAGYTAQPFDYRPSVLANDGIAGGDSGTIANDTDGDGRADTAYDAVAAQQWDVELAAGATVVLTLTTTFGVEGANGAPLAVDDADTTDEDAFVDVDVLTNDDDTDGDELEVTAVTQPAAGTAALNADETIRFTPAPDFFGLATFTYTVSDGLASSSATVSVTVRAVNDAPVAVADSATVPEDGVIEVDARLNDSAGPANEGAQALTVELLAQPAHGSAAVLPSGRVEYRPAANYFGPDSVGYRVCDDGTTAGAPDSKCATSTISFTVTPVNDPPVAVDDSATTDEGLAVDVPVLANDSDVDGDALTIDRVHAAGGLRRNRDSDRARHPSLHACAGLLRHGDVLVHRLRRPGHG